MKKTYMTPTLQVVKVKTASILAGSVPQLMGDETTATSGNLGREAMSQTLMSQTLSKEVRCLMADG